MRSSVPPPSGFNSILVQLEGPQKEGIEQIRSGFNSILVQLEVLCLGTIRQCRLGFNSILVQLEVAGLSPTAQAREMFQFHIGAIRRDCYRENPGHEVTVSIPYWCN